MAGWFSCGGNCLTTRSAIRLPETAHWLVSFDRSNAIILSGVASGANVC
jgi:hypothetical protein